MFNLCIYCFIFIFKYILCSLLIMDISRAQEILDYWIPKDGSQNMDKWFKKSSEYDAEITEKFGELLKEAEAGKGFGWLVSKDTFVAYIILTDQFSRHIYRDTAAAFKNDVATLLFTHAGFELYLDELKGYELMFAFMPYLHSEKKVAINWGYSAWEAVRDLYRTKLDSRISDDDEDTNAQIIKLVEIINDMKPHVVGHNSTIKKFGRFPKRNKALGRVSTPEELLYIAETKGRQY